MLNREIKLLSFLLLILFNSCIRESKYNSTQFVHSIQKIGNKDYYFILNKLKDSIHIYTINKLSAYEAENLYKYQIDSLICFNNDLNRFIGCRHLYVNIPDAIADDLQLILGEKINGEWYFFKSASISIPRSMVKNHPENTPLSYQQLHEIALKEVYSGYLNEKGEINEAWFTSHFEGSGWGDFENQESSLKFLNTTEKFTDKRKFFEAIRLQSAKNSWATRDTTKPIIQLPSKSNNIP